MKESNMSKTARESVPDMLPEYDFSGGVRGKYATRTLSSNMIVLAPDVAAAFPTEQSVNDALRLLMQVAKQSVGSTVG